MTWTDLRIAELTRRILAGDSCGQIAKDWDVTRNTVLGKAKRLGLPLKGNTAIRRSSRVYPANRKPPEGKRAAPKPPEPRPPVNPPAPRIEARAGVIWTARGKGCARPVGGEGADTLSCGAPTDPGETYCLGCKAIMWLPTPPARELARSIRRYL